MKSRVAIIGTALLVAAGILTVTLIYGKDAPRRDRPAIAPISGTVPLMVATPEGDTGSPLFSSSENVYIQGATGRGRPYRVFANRARPLTDGAVQLAVPRLMIEHEDGSLIQMRAKTGRVSAPGGNPQSGRLQDGVVITLGGKPFAGESVGAADGDGQIIVEMDDAFYDYDLNRVTSDSDVVVRGDGFVFEGTGLTLTWNERNGRIGQLIIEQGRRLRVRGAEIGKVEEGGGRGEDTPADAGQDAEGQTSLHFYRLELEGDVHAVGESLDVQTDELELVFAHKHDSPVDGEIDTPVEDRADFDGDAEATSTDGTGATESDDRAAGDDGVDTAEAAGEVVITWTGKLTLAPLDPPVKDLADPQDVLVKMTGHPVRIGTGEDDQIEASNVQYWIESRRMLLSGNDVYAVELDSPDMGKLTAQHLSLDPQRQQGLVEGSGHLQTRKPLAAMSGDNAAYASAVGFVSRMPAGLRVGWQDRMQISFYPPEEEPAGDLLGPLPPLRHISFEGNVEAREPASFEIQADQVGIGFDPPTDGRQSIHTITAERNVTARKHDKDHIEPMTIGGEVVTFEMSIAPDGSSVPSRLFAEGDVQLREARRQLDAQSLDVTMRPDEQGDVHVVKLIAERQVRIEFSDEGDTHVVAAHRVISDADKDEIELFGQAGEPARVEREGAVLWGGYIRVTDNRQVMQVIGTGVAEFSQAGADQADEQEAEPRRITVTWTESLRYDHERLEATFKGDVEVTGHAQLETSKLDAKRLTLVLVLADEADDRQLRDSVEGQDPQALRMIERVEADDGVAFETTRWADKVDGRVAKRLSIGAPKLLFENTVDAHGRKVELLRFIGVGELLYENRTQHQADAEASDFDVLPDARIRLTGPGATAATWAGELLVNAQTNDLRMYDDVWLMFKSWNKEDKPVQLTCDRFTADLLEAGGLEGWLTGRAADIELETVVADGGVEISHDTTVIETDHLRYTRRDSYINLTPPRGGFTVAEVDGTVTSYEGPVRWNVKSKELTASGMGPIRTPVGRR